MPRSRGGKLITTSGVTRRWAKSPTRSAHAFPLSSAILPTLRSGRPTARHDRVISLAAASGAGRIGQAHVLDRRRNFDPLALERVPERQEDEAAHVGHPRDRI